MPRDLRTPLADHRETLPHDRKLVQFYNAGFKIYQALATKGSNLTQLFHVMWCKVQLLGARTSNLGGQKVQKLVQSSTTSYFGRKYLWNRLRLSKIRKGSNQLQLLPHSANKTNFGPLTKKIIGCCPSQDHAIAFEIRDVATSGITTPKLSPQSDLPC